MENRGGRHPWTWREPVERGGPPTELDYTTEAGFALPPSVGMRRNFRKKPVDGVGDAPYTCSGGGGSPHVTNGRYTNRCDGTRLW